MKRRQAKKNYKKTISNLKPLTNMLTKIGYLFDDFGKDIPVFRNGKAITTY